MNQATNTQVSESKEYFANYLVEAPLEHTSAGVLYSVSDAETEQRNELLVICSERIASLSEIEAQAAIEKHIGAAARIQHRRIEPIADYGLRKGRPYIVFPFSSESTLKRFFREEDSHLPLHTVVKIAAQILRALSTAHASKLFHHDLRPENILLAISDDGEKLIQLRGLGIASLLAGEKSNLALMTKSAQTMAAPEYMSPELFVGGAADGRADLYSLGVILYELFSGQVPYKSDSLIDLMLAHREERVPELNLARYRNSDVAKKFSGFIYDLLKSNPAERVETADKALFRLHALFPDFVAATAPGSVSERASSAKIANLNTQTLVSAETEFVKNESFKPPQFVEPSLVAEQAMSRPVNKQLRWMKFGLSAAVVCCLALLGALVVLTKDRVQNQQLAFKAPSEKVAASVSPIDTAARKESATLEKDSLRESIVASVKTEQEAQIPEELAVPMAPAEISALGIRVRPVSEKEMEEFGLRNSSGLLVEEISSESAAYAAGLRERDLLQKVETKGESILAWKPRDVRAVADLERAIDEARIEEQRLALIIKRGTFGGLVVFIPSVG